MNERAVVICHFLFYFVSAGVCHPTAANGNPHDDPQLLLHHTQSTSPGHTPVSQLHTSVLPLSHTRPPARTTPQPSRPSQQSPRTLVWHAVINLVQRTNTAAATATAAKVSAGPKCTTKCDKTSSSFPSLLWIQPRD